MKSIRTDPSVQATRGDERIRTAVPDGTTETPYDAEWLEYDDDERPSHVVARYHVPRSQVWEGSRGRQSGRVHLHYFGRSAPVCSKRAPWYPRPPMEGEERCTRCVRWAEREGVEWPAW